MNATPTVSGVFGTGYKSVLVLRATEGESWFVVEVDDEPTQWRLYCRVAFLVPATDGQLADVQCDGRAYRFRCWRVARNTYISDIMAIADQLEREKQKESIK